MPTDRPSRLRNSTEAVRNADSTPGDEAQIRRQYVRRHNMTQNACTECKKRRTKCNGEQPCSRCAGRGGTKCVYQAQTKEAKETMQLEIERLRAQATHYDRVLRALGSTETAHMVRQQLEQGIPLETIASALGAEPSVESDEKKDLAIPRQALMGSPQSNMATQTDQSLCDSVPVSVSSLAGSSRGSAVPTEPWTRVTSDQGLIEHLLTLYFCWEYPVFTILSERVFRDDMRRGDRRYCTPLLVNAILAVACRFSDRAESRTVADDSNTAGDQFFEEAKRLLAADDTPDLIKVQALGIMSVREGSCGRKDTGWSLAGQCMRMAIYLSIQLPLTPAHRAKLTPLELEVRALTFWGSFALDQAWSQCTGRIPQLHRSEIGIAKGNRFKTDQVKVWVPYTEDDIPDKINNEQPTDVHSVLTCFYELSELVNESLYVLYTPKEHNRYEKVLVIHNKYLMWYASLPPALRRGSDSTPAVFALLMYYQFAIINLFRPFADIESENSATSARSICFEASESIAVLLKCYDELYTLRWIPFIVPYVILASTTAYLTNKPNSRVAESLSFSLNALGRMRICNTFASHALEILKPLASEQGVHVFDSEEFSPVVRIQSNASEDAQNIAYT